MNFLKSFDELLAKILVDYRNQFPEADTSQGSLIFIKSACLASVRWGLHRHQEYISKQIFPDTADSSGLDHHGYIQELPRTWQETDSAYLARLLDHIRRPPAGGNQYDYRKWAKEVDFVAEAYVFPEAQGIGTVDVVVLANEALTGSEIPTQDLIDEVRAYIDDVRPVTAKLVRVLAPSILTEDVTMTITGAGDIAMIAADITALLDGFIPGQVLYPTQLEALAIINGADNAVVTLPAGTVTPTGYEMIRPGAIDVT